MDSEQSAGSPLPSKAVSNTLSEGAKTTEEDGHLSAEQSNSNANKVTSDSPNSNSDIPEEVKAAAVEHSGPSCDQPLSSTSNVNDIQSNSDVSDVAVCDKHISVEVDLDDVVANSSQSTTVGGEHNDLDCSNDGSPTSDSVHNSVPKCETSNSEISLPPDQDCGATPDVSNNAGSEKVSPEIDGAPLFKSESDTSQSSKQESGI